MRHQADGRKSLYNPSAPDGTVSRSQWMVLIACKLAGFWYQRICLSQLIFFHTKPSKQVEMHMLTNQNTYGKAQAA